MIPPKTNSKPKELVPAGNHSARLYEIIYLGTIKTGFKDQNTGEEKEQYRVRLTWELPEEVRTFGEDEKELPMVISKEVTFSLYRGKTLTATLRTITHALLGEQLKDEEAEAFDIDDLLGRTCMLEIEHDEYQGSEYAKIVGYSSVPKGIEVKPQVNEVRTKSVTTMNADEIDELPGFIAEKMKGSKEYIERFVEGDGTEIKPEDIPF